MSLKTDQPYIEYMVNTKEKMEIVNGILSNTFLI